METATKQTERHICFDDFSFDTLSEELFRMDKRVPLQPQPARLLALFLSKPGELLRREEIRNYIWPDTLVDYEQRISSAVRAVRTALGDDRGHPRYIETISRKGYRFMMPGQDMARKGNGARNWKVWAAAGVALLAVAFLTGRSFFLDRGERGPPQAKRTVLAVLLVKDFGSDGPITVTAEGLTDRLIIRATQIAPDRLAVIARRSAMTFRDSDLSIADIADALGAQYILETSLRQRGGTAQISVSLIEAASEQNIWSSNFDGRLQNMTTLEAEIASNIAGSLGLTVPANAVTTTLRPSANENAYTAYLTGLYLLSRGADDDRRRSYDYFREAIALDPDFAVAHVGVARSAARTGRPASEVIEALEHALLLDDSIGEAHFMRAQYRFFIDWDWQGAAADFEAAVQLEPGRSEFRAAYALYLTTSGDYDRALAESERALQSDPLSSVVNGDLGYLYLRTGQYDRAIEHCRRNLRILGSDASVGSGVFGRSCLMQPQC